MTETNTGALVDDLQHVDVRVAGRRGLQHRCSCHEHQPLVHFRLTHVQQCNGNQRGKQHDCCHRHDRKAFGGVAVSRGLRFPHARGRRVQTHEEHSRRQRDARNA